MRDKKAIYMTDCVNQHAQIARSTTNPHLKCKEFIYFMTLLTTLVAETYWGTESLRLSSS